MPKPRRFPWEGLDEDPNVEDLDEPEPIDELHDLHALQREILKHPARVEVLHILSTADDLGLDSSDPGVVRRAIAVAQERWDRAAAMHTGPSAYAALLAARRAARKHPPIVYYMRMSDLVKIGTTTGIGPRLASIGAQAVMAVEPGGPGVEYGRHEQFAHLHDHGEWFRFEEDLGRHIADVREAFASTSGKTTEDWLAEWLPRRYAKKFMQAIGPI